MQFIIRKIQKEDKQELLSMMKEFYSSSAVSTNGSIEIFEQDYKTCLNNSPYLEGFILESKDNPIRKHNAVEQKIQTILGYAMIAKSFSTEFAKQIIQLEDLYLKEEYRGLGIIPIFIDYIKQTYPNSILRLEVDQENAHAIHVYRKLSFRELSYIQMKAET